MNGSLWHQRRQRQGRSRIEPRSPRSEATTAGTQVLQVSTLRSLHGLKKYTPRLCASTFLPKQERNNRQKRLNLTDGCSCVASSDGITLRFPGNASFSMNSSVVITLTRPDAFSLSKEKRFRRSTSWAQALDARRRKAHPFVKKNAGQQVSVQMQFILASKGRHTSREFNRRHAETQS